MNLRGGFLFHSPGEWFLSGLKCVSPTICWSVCSSSPSVSMTITSSIFRFWINSDSASVFTIAEMEGTLLNETLSTLFPILNPFGDRRSELERWLLVLLTSRRTLLWASKCLQDIVSLPCLYFIAVGWCGLRRL